MFAHQVSSTGNVLNSNISLWKEKYTWPPDFHSQPFVFFLFSTLHITGVYYQSVNETSVLNYNNSKPQQLSTYALTLFQYKTRVDGTDVRVGKSNLTCSLPICVKFVDCLLLIQSNLY